MPMKELFIVVQNKQGNISVEKLVILANILPQFLNMTHFKYLFSNSTEMSDSSNNIRDLQWN